MQRREQQRRAAGGGGGSSYLGGGATGYSSVPRFEAPELPISSVSRFNNNATPSAPRAPAFKGSGMKLGSKKTKQAELLDALGGDVLAASTLAEENQAVPVQEQQHHSVQKVSGRGSLPEVEAQRYALPLLTNSF